MRKSLAILALVAGCGAEQQAKDGAVLPDHSAASPEASVPGGGAAPAAARPLTGLYEGGRAGQPDQLCMVDKGSSGTQFGLVVWGGNMHSCSGSGSAVLAGTALRLTMAGDETCVIEAGMEGGIVTLPATLPPGCSYYCGARAQLGGASFARKGSSAQDALKATDLAGDPLCPASPER